MTQGKSLGMFESWSKVMGGVLEVAGIKGFLGNLDEFYEDSDAESAAWRSFVKAWWEKYSHAEVGVAELFDLVNSLDEAIDLGKGTEKSQKTRLGQELVKMRDRQFDDCRIVLAGERQRAKRWKLARVSLPQPSEPVNVSEPFPTPINSDGQDEDVDPSFDGVENSSPGFTGSHPDEETLNVLPDCVPDWPPYWRDLFDERAGYLEYEDNLSRQEAEKRAESMLRRMYIRQKNPAKFESPIKMGNR